MQMLNYSIIIFMMLLASCQCSDATSQKNSKYNPEHNVGFEGGDMVPYPPATSLTARGVAIRPAYQRWTGGVIPYEFAANISAAHVLFIEAQMRAIENLTMVNNTQCVSFRPRNVSETKFITIFNGSGCYAPVGSWGNYVGVRGVSLFDGWHATCMISGIVQHELTHVLGFYHEQSRPDRDTYVSIRWANIDPGQVFNFEKYNDTDVDTQMTSYDYGSVMHYEWNAFALNSSGPTIIPLLNSSAFIGQRIKLSPIDILEIQRYYGCVPTPNNTNTTTTSTTVATTTSTTINTTVVATTSTTMNTTVVATTSTTRNTTLTTASTSVSAAANTTASVTAASTSTSARANTTASATTASTTASVTASTTASATTSTSVRVTVSTTVKNAGVCNTFHTCFKFFSMCLILMIYYSRNAH